MVLIQFVSEGIEHVHERVIGQEGSLTGILVHVFLFYHLSLRHIFLFSWPLVGVARVRVLVGALRHLDRDSLEIDKELCNGEVVIVLTLFLKPCLLGR